MKLKNKADKMIQNIIDAVSGNGVSQEENAATGEKKVFGNMSALIRKCGAESIVMLKNNGALPLKSNQTVSVFGRCQLDYIYVGYGSGGDVVAPYTVHLIDGLVNNGVNINPFVRGFYENWCKENPVLHGFWGHWPMSYEEAELHPELVKRAAKESDAAIVVIGRAAGEDRENKLCKGSYYLTDRETAMLDLVTENFGKVIVIMDCGNIIDMSWTLKYGDKISSILYAWQLGMESGNAVADVLCGKVNPCGKLPDTIAVNYEDYPSAHAFGNKKYNIYTEDIFVGYRYFESFCTNKVLYPFGFGMSYTDFEMSAENFVHNGDKICIDICVKNIGKTAGKETVQLYVSAPQGELSKAKRSLVGFAKTKNLAPDESQTVTIETDYYSFSSFDDCGKTGNKYCYVLEKGEYKFFIGNQVRTDNLAGAIRIEEDIVLEQLENICSLKDAINRMTAIEINGNLHEKKEFLPAEGRDYKSRILHAVPEEIGFKGEKGYTLSQVADGKITIEDFISTLTDVELEGLTRGEGIMNSSLGVIGNAGAFAGTIPSLRNKGVKPVITTDGPAGIRIRKYSSLLPCGTAMAATWDTNLVEELTTEMGKELTYHESDVLLAPGMNIHRNPLCGRNFEYFSEDPVVSGKMAAAYVNGIQKSGKSACPKHFACNNQEVNRTKNDTRISQRALREIYLKGFEICVKEAKPLNIMTSYNKINGVWSHYNFDLVTTVLRNEWNYNGNVMTDWWMQKSASPEFPSIRDNAYRVRAQVDVLMPGGKRSDKKYKSDGTLLETLGQADGITRAELERTAKNVLSLVLKLKY